MCSCVNALIRESFGRGRDYHIYTFSYFIVHTSYLVIVKIHTTMRSKNGS